MIATFQRQEMKFMLKPAQFEALLPQLEEYLQPDAFCRNGREYNIYNLYYDTPDHYLIRQSLSKPYYKEKLRMRSYKIPTSPEDKVFLELKKKIGGVVNKRRMALTYQQAWDFVASGQRPSTADYMNEQVAREIEFFLGQHQVGAAAYIYYKRLAFVGREDKDFRMTFDYDILTCRDADEARAGQGQRLIDEGLRLMEVKFAAAVPIWLARLCSQLKIYPTSFSKYGREYQQFCQAQTQAQAGTPGRTLVFLPSQRGFNPQLTEFPDRLSVGF